MARNQQDDMWQASLTGLLQGIQAGQAKNYEREQAMRKISEEIYKQTQIEEMKNNIRVNNAGNIKPAPGMKLKSQKMNQYGIMENEYEPTAASKPAQYKVVGGKILQLPSEPGEQPTVAYEDPDKIKARQGASEGIIRNTEDMLNTVKTVRKGKKYFGPAGGVPTLITSGLGMSEDYGPRKVWESEMQKLLAQRMMDKMVELKAASKTGSTGFGQLTEREGRKIQEASTALNRELLPDDADRYLAIMEDSLSKIIEGARSESIGYSSNAEEPSALLKPPAKVLSFTSTKITRANQLRKQYPNLSKKQIIDMVNKEF